MVTEKSRDELSFSTEAWVSYTPTERLVQDFASRGLVVLAPESLGVSPEVHEEIYGQQMQYLREGQPVSPATALPVLDVLNAPGVIAACNQLVGKNWAVVPFTHNASFLSGVRDQHWHKDDNAPYNGRKQRHHQAVQIEMLYYPQAVREDMGPTATVPYSQYWTFNHEENHDNFAGADHLDFDYQLSGMESEPVSGPDSIYDPDDIIHRRTAHDIRMREAITDLNWPLVKSFEVGPLRAGSVVLYSHNTFHRGNHRRDDWRTWDKNPRFMWRFWIYRTTDPATSQGRQTVPHEVDWQGQGVDPLTGIDLTVASEDVTEVWRYHASWMQTGRPPLPKREVQKWSTEVRQAEASRLFAQLYLSHDKAEPSRIGAAYRLASIGDSELALRYLGQAIFDERESVRRAATYGLAAVGPDATDTFIEAAKSPVKWIRKAGVYGLGEVSPLDEQVLAVVSTLLATDRSVYVRSVAAGTVGCLGRRAIATGVGTTLIPRCFDALVQVLRCEKNRLAMDRSQKRSIKFVRPTDNSDVCEGGGVDFGIERFKPVRSAVRENALWAMVILSSHGTAVIGDALDPVVIALKNVVRNDQNVICVGFALDALNRLANLQRTACETSPAISGLPEQMFDILRGVPTRCWESLVRGGLDSSVAAEFEGTI